MSLLILFTGLAGVAAAGVPRDITDLVASPGSAPGSIRLDWTNLDPVHYYIIKYDNKIENASSYTDWSSADAHRIDEYPLYLTNPSSSTGNTRKYFEVTGLTQGVQYRFMMKVIQLDGGTYWYSNFLSNSATAQARIAGSEDGKGSVAAIAPATIKFGLTTPTTITFTVDATGIQAGGEIAVRVPDYWDQPWISQYTEYVYSGGVSITTSGISAPLTLYTSGQLMIVRVDSGELSGGDVIKFHYNSRTCNKYSDNKFRILTKQQSWGTLTELGIASGSPQVISLTPGDPYQLSYTENNFNLVAPLNQWVKVNVGVYDQCFNLVNATALINFRVVPSYWGESGSYWDYLVDPVAVVSSHSAKTPLLNVAVDSVTINSGENVATFYYKITDLGTDASNHNIKVYYLWQYPWVSDLFKSVRPLATGITNTSVDTGNLSPGVKSVSFYPGTDSNNNVYFNFSIGDLVGWQVIISSDLTNFSSPVKQFGGYGAGGRFSWDGHMDSNGGVNYPVAPPGTYGIKIIAEGGAIEDTSLSAQLVSYGVKGTVVHDLGAVSDADVNFYGPTGGRGFRTGADGKFMIYGLRPGEYTLEVRKDGYDVLRLTNVSVETELTDMGDITMIRAAQLKMVIVRSTSSYMPEISGQVQANSTTNDKSAMANVHFAVGKSTADTGDNFSATPSTCVILNLNPGLAYNIRFSVPGLSHSVLENYVISADSEPAPFVMAKSADITGFITIPSANVMNYSQWFNVDAGVDSDLDGVVDNPNNSTSRYSGGGNIEPGSSTGSFRICGIAPGHYALRAYLQGFAPSTGSVTVVSGSDPDPVVFPQFAKGGTLSGTITINGNTGGIADSFSGMVNLNVNAQSNTTNLGSWASLQVASNATSSSVSYELTGLADGIYQIWIYLPGFECSTTGSIFATVSGGVGTKDIVFNQFTGKVSGTIALPDGFTDYENVIIELNSSGGGSSSVSLVPTAASYEISGLGTQYYYLKARYATSGAVISRNFQVVNGRTTNVDLALDSPVFTISGKVTSSARSPFNLNYIVNRSTPTAFRDTSTESTVYFPANRVMAVKYSGDNKNYESNMLSSMPEYDPYTVFIGTYDSTGNYSIPRVPPGTYMLTNNGELDGDLSTGKEISETSRMIYVKANVANQDFNMTDGYNVSGTMRVASGVSETGGRNLKLKLKNGSGDVVVEKSVYLTGTSITYILERIPPGNYVLTTSDEGYSKKYSAKDVTVDVVSANLTNKDVSLLRAAKIQGKIQIQPANILLTQSNYSTYINDSSFEIAAKADPWFEGGWNSAYRPLINGNGYFTIYANPGTYEIIFKNSGMIGMAAMAQGKKQLVQMTMGGVKVEAGATYDLGVINLREGGQISGTVTDKSGTPLPNIYVRGVPTGENQYDDDFSVQAYTDEYGRFTLYGIDKDVRRYYDITAAPRASGKGDSGALMISGIKYGPVLKTQVDTRNTTTLSFQLEPALGSISGRVVAIDGAQLEVPFDEDGGKLGAFVIMNRRGDIPQGNPLGNIEEGTDPDGYFSISGLVPGSYDMWVLASGYSSKVVRNIEVGAGNSDIGELVISTGAILSGKLSKVDGSAPNTSDVDTLVAVRNGFEELIIGNLKTDAAGNVLSYSLAGFQPNMVYSILLFNENDEVYPIASNLTINTNTERNFVIEDKQPEIYTQASRGIDGSINVQFEFTKALRNETTDDNDSSKIILKDTGQGTLSYPENWLSSDRKRILVVYTPAEGETQFKLRMEATFNAVNNATGLHFTNSKTYTYYVGIGKSRSKRLTNVGGGAVQLENDASEFVSQAGTFVSTDTVTDSANLEVEVTFRAAQSAGTLASESPVITGSGVGACVMAEAKRLGLSAYPGEMSSAMAKAMASEVNPFSSFYDIFLPQSVAHFFPDGKEAKLCLVYDETVSDPFALNVYYYNARTNEYLLENQNKMVDVDNSRICVNISHASVFTVLASSDSIISGGSGYTGELAIMNFPNPFNLKSKTVTLQNPGTAAANQTIDGTMIKISVPPSVSGEAKIEIFNVAAEMVRTLHTTIPVGGAHYYLAWDGKNDHGQPVASGTYIGRFTLGGANEKFFKMAVLK